MFVTKLRCFRLPGFLRNGLEKRNNLNPKYARREYIHKNIYTYIQRYTKKIYKR